MRSTLSILTILAILSPVALVGCDRTVAESTRTTSDSDGNVKQQTKTVKQVPAGNVTVTKEETSKTVNNNP